VTETTAETERQHIETLLRELVTEPLAGMRKQLDHLDTQLHEVRQFIDENRPVLERASRMLDNPVSKYLAARKKHDG
jgi:hypothetical protein